MHHLMDCWEWMSNLDSELATALDENESCSKDSYYTDPDENRGNESLAVLLFPLQQPIILKALGAHV
jgi:hypothetical protein